MKKQLQFTTKLNQQGMISITVTLVFMLVISLTVLGFSQVSQRNSRAALDRQLASQAFYAAETGANDVMNAIAKHIDARETVPPQKECQGSYTQNNGEVYVVGTDADIKYTCLLVNPEPKDQEISNLDDSSAILALNSTTGNLNSNTIEWKKTASPPAGATLAQCPPVGENIDAATWANTCPFSLLKVDLVKINTTTLQSPLAAIKDTMTIYLYPRVGAVTPTYTYFNGPSNENIYGVDGAPQGLIVPAACSADSCKAIIDGLNFSNAYLRVKAMYVSTPTFKITAGGAGTYSNGQVVIDVTGKARDVLRRVQIRANMTGSSSRVDAHRFSDYELQTTDSICKRYYSSPTASGQASPVCS